MTRERALEAYSINWGSGARRLPVYICSALITALDSYWLVTRMLDMA
jgi:hypothetical protein